MTDTTRAPDYWALLEEITEYRGRLIRLANAVYLLIDSDVGPGPGDEPEGDACTAENGGSWPAPVIPLRARGA